MHFNRVLNESDSIEEKLEPSKGKQSLLVVVKREIVKNDHCRVIGT